ncbi:hypothetical protein [Kaistia defluvii]|uniref:Flagellar protein FlgN n=1 Tax=Kaistia defluvii TaxID=410841 RepID=A0ABV2QXR3_9HYPH
MTEARSQHAHRRPSSEPAPEAGNPDAATTLTGIEATMDALLQLIEAEAELLRAGKIFAARELGQRKSYYAKRYMDELAVLGAIGQSLEDLDPGQVARLRQRHEEFRSVLQINLAALATARAVSDSALQAVVDNSRNVRRPEPYNGEVRPNPRFARNAG